MASPAAAPAPPARATCARESWDSFFDAYDRLRDRNRKKYDSKEGARALLDRGGFDGSNVNEVDSCGKTLLMRSCPGYYYVTNALLERNADPNMVCHKGCTAMHYLSRSSTGYRTRYDAHEWGADEGDDLLDRSCVAGALIKHGATATLSHRDSHGFTPLVFAAHNDRKGLLDYLVCQETVPRTEKIDALELLGAKQVLYAFCHGHNPFRYNGQTWYDYGIEFLTQAMFLRHENPRCLKELAPQNKLYNNYSESQTSDELMDLEDVRNRRALRAEAYLIVQRLVPKEMMIAWRPISHESDYDYSTFKVAEAMGHRGCWKEGVDILSFLIGLHVESNSPDPKKMLTGIKSFLEGVLGNRYAQPFFLSIAFHDMHRLLQVVVDTVVIQNRYLTCNPVSQCYNYQKLLDKAAWIVYTLACLYLEDAVLERLIQVLEKLASWSTRWSAQWKNLISTKVLGESGDVVENGLSKTCRRDANDDFNISITHALITSAAAHPGWDLFPKKVHVVQKVFCRVIMLDHVNAVNWMLCDKRMFHEAIGSWQSHMTQHPRRARKLKTMQTIITLLMRYGFSWSQTDEDKDRTVTEMLQPPLVCSQKMRSAYSEALELLESLKRCNLQELAARVIRNYHIPYRGVIPKFLYKLIELE